MDQEFPLKIETIFRNVKYPRLEVMPGIVRIILPLNLNYDEEFARKLVKKHKDWILKKHSLLEEALKVSEKLPIEKRSIEDFKKEVLMLVEKYSKELGVSPRKVFFRRMKSRWGSCSGARNITVNSLARFLPKDLVEYIVYHELCHLVERKHNERFWALVSRKFPDFGEKEFLLLAYRLKLDREVGRLYG
ncbi:MAG: hypothetical protein DRP08_03240 [Candidatus Aenigmatarchaeota archaeon]|nr:MAG: hypothetical protein DRP08_03240 [Candidatus Aenigmarchaeota archaeon]